MKKNYRHIATRLERFLADDAGLTKEDLRAELEADGVDVDAFLARFQHVAKIPERPANVISSHEAVNPWNRMPIEYEQRAAATERVIGEGTPLAVMPGILVESGGSSRDVEAKLFRRPLVSPDGTLVLDILVDRLVAHDEPLSMELVTKADSTPIPVTKTIEPGKRQVIEFPLPAETQTDWRAFETMEWKNLPFRFVLRPLAKGASGIAKAIQFHERPEA